MEESDMVTRYKLFATLVLISAVFYTVPVVAAPMEATISLGRDPEPPYCVANPGGVIDITWNIEHTTTPNYVYYKLEDPTRTIIYEDSTYAGSTGISINRQWVIPAGAPDGKYWVRVEYWSFEAGNEANAEVTFYACTNTGEICARKLEDTDGDDDCYDNNSPIANWWICLQTPFGDTFCKKTGADGRVCWTSLPLGDYTVYEPSLGGMIAVGPTSYPVTLTEDPVEFDFCNKHVPTPVRMTTWGMIKSMYR
jgi:hypothetical protein